MTVCMIDLKNIQFPRKCFVSWITFHHFKMDVTFGNFSYDYTNISLALFSCSVGQSNHILRFSINLNGSEWMLILILWDKNAYFYMNHRVYTHSKITSPLQHSWSKLVPITKGCFVQPGNNTWCHNKMLKGYNPLCILFKSQSPSSRSAIEGWVPVPSQTTDMER